ncbi:MAG: hypothetical protein AB7K24_08300 [Gemmataceae bacterium]
MLICPMCKKDLDEPVRVCPRCQADLSLLADYVDNMRDGLSDAERLTRSGRLGEAVWAYLEVLEIEPENAAARKQVGRVVAAVRHFDRTAVGRRWLRRLGRAQRWRDWWAENWLLVVGIGLLCVAACGVGYHFGFRAGLAWQTPQTRDFELTPSSPVL